jgi:hypothetical protein
MNILVEIGVIVLAAAAAVLIIAGRYSGDAMIAGAGFIPKSLVRFVFGERKHS